MTEQQKTQDLMKWVGLINNIKVRAEEIVLKESVYGEQKGQSEGCSLAI